MKIAIVAFCLSVFYYSAVQGQVTKALLDYAVPCAVENNVSADQLSQLQSGNIAGLLPIVGCFSDCVSKKVGAVNADDTFAMDYFKGKLAEFVLPNQVDAFVDQCTGQIGEGACNVSGEFYHCIINIVISNVLG